MAQGHGISDAVRSTIPAWIDNETMAAIHKAKPSLAGWTVRDAKKWARINKRGAVNGASTRLYRCNGAPGVILEVRTNYNDTQITHFGLRVDGKYVTGGDCRVASVNVSATAPNQPRMDTIKTGRYSSSDVKLPKPAAKFRRLSAEEMSKLMTGAEHSDEAAFDRLFDEREV